MNFQLYKSEFTKEAKRKGYTDAFIEACLSYSKRINDQGLPIIYNTEHLSLLLGYDEKYLKRAITHNAKYYRSFTIAKKTGKPRTISEPLPNLKEIQSWILNTILSKVTISRYAKAYVKGKGLKHNVRFHVNQKKLLTLDLHNFFPSLSINEVQQIFLNLGYTTKLSDLLSKLCCKSGSLPQGAPTSPYLSNLIMLPIDNKIGDFCSIRKIRYTRYADDLSFSGDFNVDELKSYVAECLAQKNLKLNEKKSRLMLKNHRQMVTGVVVNQKLHANRIERKSIRQQLYYIQKFGLEDHILKTGITKRNYLKHLLGKVGFITYINPNDKEFLQYKSTLKELILEEALLLEE
jgi:RNA-directed DNA polymerase